MSETKKEKITPKKAYTRDTRRLHMGQYYSEGGNVYKNSTIEDDYSDIGNDTEKYDKFSKAQNKLENLGVRLSSIGEAPHYVALDDNKNSYLRGCFDIFDVSDDDIERYFRVKSSNLFDILHKYNIPFDKFKDVMSNIINGKIDLKKFYKE
ncbi:MAG: hypothetical protein K6F04_01440, partial [bacterium]|nr:hypothetical protein [bacterium]